MSLIGNSIGVELEYVGDVDAVAQRLADGGWVAKGDQHDYHCHCETCDVNRGLLWRYQRDSTVSGEFISRVLWDWPTAKLAFELMEDAVDASNVRSTQSTGLHVHVGPGRAPWRALIACYLSYERWIQAIGSGPFPDKREGMNITLLQALREQGAERGDTFEMNAAVGQIQDQIAEDRHADLNYSDRYGTYEFRVFNSVKEAWRMELAARLAVAFTRLAGGTNLVLPSTFRIPADPIRTLQPREPLESFIHLLKSVDPILGRLIAKQLKLMPPRMQPEPELEPELEPEPEPELEPELEPEPLSATEFEFTRLRPVGISDTATYLIRTDNPW